MFARPSGYAYKRCVFKNMAERRLEELSFEGWSVISIREDDNRGIIVWLQKRILKGDSA